jgi:hypothetical protein
MTHHFSGGNATPLLPVAERHANGAISLRLAPSLQLASAVHRANRSQPALLQKPSLFPSAIAIP